MSIWASIFEDGTPIPFLGLEAAVGGAAVGELPPDSVRIIYVADELLANSIRMISVDAYHLATIIEAYASCAKSLQVRLMLDADAVGLTSRQQTMGDNLRRALVGLSKVEKRRDAAAARELDKASKMDSDLAAYVQCSWFNTELPLFVKT